MNWTVLCGALAAAAASRSTSCSTIPAKTPLSRPTLRCASSTTGASSGAAAPAGPASGVAEGAATPVPASNSARTLSGHAPSQPMWRWLQCAASVKNPSSPISHGVPISVGRNSSGRSANCSATSFAASFVGDTGSPSTVATSNPRPTKWFDTDPPDVNCRCPVFITDNPTSCPELPNLCNNITIRGSISPERRSASTSAGRSKSGSPITASIVA